jgi:hypothetical protein
MNTSQSISSNRTTSFTETKQQDPIPLEQDESSSESGRSKDYEPPVQKIICQAGESGKIGKPIDCRLTRGRSYARILPGLSRDLNAKNKKSLTKTLKGLKTSSFQKQDEWFNDPIITNKFEEFHLAIYQTAPLHLENWGSVIPKLYFGMLAFTLSVKQAHTFYKQRALEVHHTKQVPKQLQITQASFLKNWELWKNEGYIHCYSTPKNQHARPHLLQAVMHIIWTIQVISKGEQPDQDAYTYLINRMGVRSSALAHLYRYWRLEHIDSINLCVQTEETQLATVLEKITKFYPSFLAEIEQGAEDRSAEKTESLRKIYDSYTQIVMELKLNSNKKKLDSIIITLKKCYELLGLLSIEETPTVRPE